MYFSCVEPKVLTIPYLIMSGGGWKPRGTRFQPQDGPSKAAGAPGGGAGRSGSEGPPAAKRRRKIREQKMDVVGEYQ